MVGKVVWHCMDAGIVRKCRLNDEYQYEALVQFGCSDVGCYCSEPEWIPIIELVIIR